VRTTSHDHLAVIGLGLILIGGIILALVYVL
jgi:hypothetical protein